MSNSKPDQSPSQPASQPLVPSERDWQILLRELVDRRRAAGESDFAVCGHLAPELAAIAKSDWTGNYIHQVLRRSKHLQPSPRLIWAIEKLHARKPRARNEKGKRLYIIFHTKEDKNYVEQILSVEERRKILLTAASEKYLKEHE